MASSQRRQAVFFITSIISLMFNLSRSCHVVADAAVEAACVGSCGESATLTRTRFLQEERKKTVRVEMATWRRMPAPPACKPASIATTPRVRSFNQQRRVAPALQVNFVPAVHQPISLLARCVVVADGVWHGIGHMLAFLRGRRANSRIKVTPPSRAVVHTAAPSRDCKLVEQGDSMHFGSSSNLDIDADPGFGPVPCPTQRNASGPAQSWFSSN